MGQRMRRYRGEGDYWRIRDFLRRVFTLNERREKSWQAYRFDYWRWHGIANLDHGSLERDVFIWEDPDDEIGAVLNREGPGYAYFQVDPGSSNKELILAMLSQAEEKLAISTKDRRLKLNVFAGETDEQRQEVFQQHGYVLSNVWEHQHSRLLSSTAPEVILPDGYQVRALGDEGELPARSFLSWKVFHPDEPVDDYSGWEWYKNIQRAPLYRRDLDLVVESPEGEMCSFCTIWFDDVTRVGAFEPVGTSPEYQRLGLGKAVISEGLHRLKDVGAEIAFVGSGSEGASAFYSSIGFNRCDVSQMWTKFL
jgi:ribosomal protein S18 acetylase RimI-like enzyme